MGIPLLLEVQIHEDYYVLMYYVPIFSNNFNDRLNVKTKRLSVHGINIHHTVPSFTHLEKLHNNIMDKS